MHFQIFGGVGKRTAGVAWGFRAAICSSAALDAADCATHWMVAHLSPVCIPTFNLGSAGRCGSVRAHSAEQGFDLPARRILAACSQRARAHRTSQLKSA